LFAPVFEDGADSRQCGVNGLKGVIRDGLNYFQLYNHHTSQSIYQEVYFQDRDVYYNKDIQARNRHFMKKGPGVYMLQTSFTGPCC
jgi:hypothetical protein